uniref:Uncharacterized protein n=1 Tax=Romanomermis culicivorax TaxID=13658 RepID=A0A915KLY4_ROMCU
MLFSQQHTYNYHQEREILADSAAGMMPQQQQRQMIPGHDDQGHIPSLKVQDQLVSLNFVVINSRVLRSKRPKLRSSEVEIDVNNSERLSIGNHVSPVDQCSSVNYDSCRQQTTRSLEGSPQQQNSDNCGKVADGDADGRIDLGRPPPLYPHGNGWTYPASFGYVNGNQVHPDIRLTVIFRSSRLLCPTVGNDHATKLTVDVDCGTASDECPGRNSSSTATANSSETLSYSTNKGPSLSNYHSQYYNSAVYNSQYYNPTGVGSLYGSGNQNYLSQTYAGKSFKSSPYSSLGVYLGANSIPSASAYYNNYSSTGLGSQQVLGNHSAFDYSSAYGCYNGSYYPSNSTF